MAVKPRSAPITGGPHLESGVNVSLGQISDQASSPQLCIDCEDVEQNYVLSGLRYVSFAKSTEVG